jgi:hypothetical protein
VTKEQIQAFGKITPGPWTVEFVQKWPFGIRVKACETEILHQDAYCSSTVQETRADNESGYGFKSADVQMARDEIAQQDANAISFAALPDLLKERRELLKALAYVHDLIQQIPGGIDEDADEANLSPEDAAQHIGGLIWKRVSAVLTRAEGAE